MKISKQAQRDAKRLFRACLTQGTLDEQRVRDTVTQVAKAKPRGFFGILTHFQRLIKLEVARRTARVETAVDAPPQLQAVVRQNLEKLQGRGLQVSFETKPALLGGMRIKVGCDVYDGSVQARLEQLAEGF
jgi:F-type H+-transporting ATPase subunit delta